MIKTVNDSVEGKYFVVSDVDQPDQIFFSWEAAAYSKERYIDIFNEKGEWVEAWKLIDENEMSYTDEF